MLLFTGIIGTVSDHFGDNALDGEVSELDLAECKAEVRRYFCVIFI